MSALPRHHGGAPTAEKGWICLRSAAISRMVAVELLTDQTLQVPDDVQQALRKLTLEQPQAMPQLPLRLWVQIDGVTWAAQTMQEQERQDSALQILVLRQANFPLLRRLFNISRERWVEVRKALNAPPPPRSCAQPSEAQIAEIYACWSRLLREYDNDVDRWVVLAQQFKALPMAALFSIIYLPGDAL